MRSSEAFPIHEFATTKIFWWQWKWIDIKKICSYLPTSHEHRISKQYIYISAIKLTCDDSCSKCSVIKHKSYTTFCKHSTKRISFINILRIEIETVSYFAIDWHSFSYIWFTLLYAYINNHRISACFTLSAIQNIYVCDIKIWFIWFCWSQQLVLVWLNLLRTIEKCVASFTARIYVYI